MKTKIELYGELQEAKHENKQLRKQLILTQQNNDKNKN
tara:strand:+ start:12195 stop:12308 length:114 start_codon:yes stop_codon:yes gene_type:complete